MGACPISECYTFTGYDHATVVTKVRLIALRIEPEYVVFIVALLAFATSLQKAIRICLLLGYNSGLSSGLFQEIYYKYNQV